MKDITVIAPIKDIYDKTVELIGEFNYKNVDVYMGSLYDALKIAEELEKEGTKIIVTRGGTYQLLKKHLRIPVVEIKVSVYDIVESFDKIDDTNEVIGLVGYSNIVVGFDVLKKFIPNEVVKIEIKDNEDIYSVINANREKGIKTFIGDSTIKGIVEELDCRGFLINSQKDSILNSILEAKRINHAIKIENYRTKQITAITDFVYNGIVSIDVNDKITIFNKASEKIFGITHNEAVNKNIKDIIPNNKLLNLLKSGDVVIGEIINVRDSKVSCSITPINLEGNAEGAVLSFQEAQELQNLEQKIRRSLDAKGFIAKYSFKDIIYKSAEMKECIEIAKEYSKYNAPIYIRGESGVGKELFCQSIHNYSSRKNGPFVAVNCAGIAPTLIESEFFGFEEGSFTGAKKKGRPGVFELAHKSTLFLDEISEIPIEMQGRLLRVLQEKEIMRVGGEKVIPIDVKIITASNKDLKKMIEAGLFRKDLYYRINVLSISIPSLNDRKEDVLLLAEHFIKRSSKAYNKEPIKLTKEVKNLLLNINYEGNVRELENIIEKAVVLSSFEHLKNYSNEQQNNDVNIIDTCIESEVSLKELENSYILKIYNKTDHNLKKTSEILKIDKSTLWRKMKQL